MTSSDELKGRAKEAAGALTDDDKLKNQGKVDQITGKVKSAVDEAADKVGEGIEAARDKIQRH